MRHVADTELMKVLAVVCAPCLPLGVCWSSNLPNIRMHVNDSFAPVACKFCAVLGACTCSRTVKFSFSKLSASSDAYSTNAPQCTSPLDYSSRTVKFSFSRLSASSDAYSPLPWCMHASVLAY